MVYYFCITCQDMVPMDRCVDPYNFKCDRCEKLVNEKKELDNKK